VVAAVSSLAPSCSPLRSWPGPVRCPQVEARQAPVRAPFFPDRFDLARTGHVIQLVKPLNRRSDAQVTDRQDVRPLEVDQQKHVGRPSPESSAGRNLRTNLLVRELVQLIDLQLTGND